MFLDKFQWQKCKGNDTWFCRKRNVINILNKMKDDQTQDTEITLWILSLNYTRIWTRHLATLGTNFIYCEFFLFIQNILQEDMFYQN